jgi:hypothetical protein
VICYGFVAAWPVQKVFNPSERLGSPDWMESVMELKVQ